MTGGEDGRGSEGGSAKTGGRGPTGPVASKLKGGPTCVEDASPPLPRASHPKTTSRDKRPSS